MGGRGRHPRLRRVYREAWAERLATGDASDEVLLRSLRRRGLLQRRDESAVLATVLGWWRRGVSPRGVRREVWQMGAAALAGVGRAAWALARTFRPAPSVPFDPVVGPEELWAAGEALADWIDDERSLEVWFDVAAAPAPTVDVQLEDGRLIGSARLPPAFCDEARTAHDGGRSRPEGELELVRRDGAVTIGALRYVGLVDDDEADPA